MKYAPTQNNCTEQPINKLKLNHTSAFSSIIFYDDSLILLRASTLNFVIAASFDSSFLEAKMTFIKNLTYNRPI